MNCFFVLTFKIGPIEQPIGLYIYSISNSALHDQASGFHLTLDYIIESIVLPKCPVKCRRYSVAEAVYDIEVLM